MEEFSRRVRELKERVGVVETKLKLINTSTLSRNKNERAKEQKKRFKMNISENVELNEDDTAEKLEVELGRLVGKLKRYQGKVNSKIFIF